MQSPGIYLTDITWSKKRLKYITSTKNKFNQTLTIKPYSKVTRYFLICDTYQKVCLNFNPRDLTMIVDCEKTV